MTLRQRDPRIRDKAHKGFIAALPCIACACEGVTRYGVEVAHVRHGYPGWRPTGMAEKPSDHRTVPLCTEHHRTGPDAQHSMREDRWWAKWGIYPPTLCADLVAAYPDLRDGIDTIEVHAHNARQAKRIAERAGGLSSPIEAAPEPVTVHAHLTGRIDERGNREVILQAAGEGRTLIDQRAYVAPDCLVRP